jgi:hypothetical protein
MTASMPQRLKNTTPRATSAGSRASGHECVTFPLNRSARSYATQSPATAPRAAAIEVAPGVGYSKWIYSGNSI